MRSFSGPASLSKRHRRCCCRLEMQALRAGIIPPVIVSDLLLSLVISRQKLPVNPGRTGKPRSQSGQLPFLTAWRCSSNLAKITLRYRQYRLLSRRVIIGTSSLSRSSWTWSRRSGQRLSSRRSILGIYVIASMRINLSPSYIS